MSTAKKKVLFLCSGNSARSQMAEALLRYKAGDMFDVFSAGTVPEKIDDKALSALANFGVPTEDLESKDIQLFEGKEFDFIISLCDKARQEYKTYPISGQHIAWDFADPKSRSGTVPFQATLNELNNRISMFVSIQSKKIPQLKIDPIQFYKCFTDEIRLKCLMLIQYEGELCVCELMAALDDIQPKVSRHLAVLKKSELLIDRKQGQWVFYRINPDLPDWAKSVLAQTAESNVGFIQQNINNLTAMGSRPDRAKVCCE
ncbi:MAG: metalloregulator ArsR/SmtB family transcription factor [Methylophaga sp.]|nr:metalloregulator ArsR/SmtB family transcription factor [Methylophaga sp.]